MSLYCPHTGCRHHASHNVCRKDSARAAGCYEQIRPAAHFVRLDADARHRAFAVRLVRSLDAWDHAPEWSGGCEYGYRTREEFEKQRALYCRTKRAARRWLCVMEGKR